MGSTVTIIWLLVAICGIHSSAAKRCRVGDTWNVECNKCLCTIGGRPLCTEHNCQLDALHVTSSLGECKPYSRWRVDCNYCSCSESGEVRCTNNVCDLNELTSRVERSAGCKEGDRWKEGCNECHCSKDGRPLCTRKACLPEETSGGRKRRRTNRCTPGTSWKEDCNYCTCANNGFAACTLKACLSQSPYYPITTNSRLTRETEPGCKEGDRWKDDCNECFCSNDGTPACTRKACPPKESTGGRAKRLGKSCNPGDKWKESCNTCTCLADGTAACTRRACTRRKRNTEIDSERQTQCRPAAKMCGSPSSTSNSQSGKSDSNRKHRGRGRCVPGSTWEQKCSVCYCDAQSNVECIEKSSCMDEDDDSQRPKDLVPLPKGRGRCDQGSTWQVSCNICSCDQYGNVNCTNDLCEDEVDTDSLESDDLRIKRSTFSNKRSSRWCKPGDVYLFNCDKCPCRVRGITGCRSVTCRER